MRAIIRSAVVGTVVWLATLQFGQAAPFGRPEPVRRPEPRPETRSDYELERDPEVARAVQAQRHEETVRESSWVLQAFGQFEPTKLSAPAPGEKIPKPTKDGVYLVANSENFLAYIRAPLSEPAKYSAHQLETMARESSSRDLMNRVDELARLAGIRDGLTPPEVVVRTVLYSSEGGNSGRLTIRPGANGLDVVFRLPTQTFFDAYQIRQYARSSKHVLLGGDKLPAPVSVDFALMELSLGYRSRVSPNRSEAQYAKAMSRGNQRLSANTWTLENALPYGTDLQLAAMLRWMNLRYVRDFFAWSNLSKGVAQAKLLAADKRQASTRASLVNSLSKGSTNVLVLVAHNDSRKLYFPNGDELTFEEIAQIKRSTAPDRVILLVTCSAGGVSGEYLSLAETMLANNLATSVFASTTDVDASKVPALLETLEASSMGDALRAHGFDQYVMEDANDYARAQALS